MADGLALVLSLKTLACLHKEFGSCCLLARLIIKPVLGMSEARNVFLEPPACSDPLHLPPLFSELSKIQYWLLFPIYAWARLQHFSISFILFY